VERGYLGIQLQEITHELAPEFGLDEVKGVLVADVYENAPADKAGIKHGDVIVEFDGKPIRDLPHLQDVVSSTKIGKRVNVKIIRKGAEKVLEVKVGEFPEEDMVSSERNSSTSSDAKPLTGLRVRNLTDEIASRYGYESGVIIAGVKRGSPADKAELSVGDLIMEIEDEQVRDVKDYRRLAKKYKDKEKIMLYVYKYAARHLSYIKLKAD